MNAGNWMRMFVCVALLAVVMPVTADQLVTRNGSLERGEGANATDPMVPAEWVEFGTNVERSGEGNYAPADGGHVLKAFGDTQDNNVGAYQDVDVAAGDSVDITWACYSKASDKLGGTGVAGVRVEFVGIFGNIISSQELLAFDANSTADVWDVQSLESLTAPSGTSKVRVYCKLDWSGAVSGAVFWDGVEVSINGGENVILNGDFEQAGEGDQSPTGIDQWAGFNDQEQSDAYAYHGEKSVKIGTTEAYDGLYQSVGPLYPGDHIIMTAKVMHPSSNPVTGEVVAGIKLEFSSDSPSLPSIENLGLTPEDAADTWTIVDLGVDEIEVPEGASIARVVMIYFGQEGSTGKAYFDAASFSVDGGSNALLNPSFENGDGGPNGIDYWDEFNTEEMSSCEKANFFEQAPYQGNFTARAEGEAVAGIFQDIELSSIGAQAGDLVDLHAYLLMPSSDPLVGASAGVKIEWRGGSVPPNVDLFDDENLQVLDASTPTDTWIDLELDYTMPAGMQAIGQFTNLVAFAGAGTTGEVYFDVCEAIVVNRFDGADSDADDDEDLDDFSRFQMCFNNYDFGCAIFDSDDDGDVDLADFTWFQARMTAPNPPEEE